MADQQTRIQIPERLEDEAPATAEQLQFIRQLVSGMSLQGYRFDYRKLGTQQAAAITDQLIALNKQQGKPTPARRQGPGCFASLAKTVIVLAVVSAIAAGLYFYVLKDRIDSFRDAANNEDEQQEQDSQADPPATPDSKQRESKIFSGLSVGETPSTPPADDAADTPSENPSTDAPPPKTPDLTPPTDPALLSQLAGLEELLVKLSQYTRSDFAPTIRAQSSQAMQRKLADFGRALTAIESLDPGLAERIRSVIAAFADEPMDSQAIRDEIDAIRQALEPLQTRG